jgi:hypothetical protein
LIKWLKNSKVPATWHGGSKKNRRISPTPGPNHMKLGALESSLKGAFASKEIGLSEPGVGR